MPSREGNKGEKGSKMPKMFDLESTGLRISTRLANKTKQKYGIFSKFSLAVIGACDVANNLDIFLTISNNISSKLIDTLMGP